MHVENAVVETEAVEQNKQEQKQTQESEKQPSKGPVMKAVLLKKGQYVLSNSLVLPSFDVCLLGEEGTVLAPEPNVLAILGVGNKDVRCSKCGYVLVMKIKRPQVQNIAVKCPSCGSVNQL